MEKNNSKIKIIVAMSGGVDSSVAAAFLKRDGFDVVGIFMKFWKDPSSLVLSSSLRLSEPKASGQAGENRCCSVESEKMARLVAKKIGIPFYVFNVEKDFKKKVVDYFLKEYKKGNTPNPCVVCNKEIKFGLLIEKALKLDANYIATGHYARIIREIPNPKSQIPKYKLLKGKDKNKDQSYFLWQLNQKQLSRVLFPVGNYTKPEVRKLAKKFNLPVAETKESQEVCFIQNTTNEFLKKYLKTNPGPVIEQAQNGVKKIVGQHQGLWFYTIGQRRGLEIPQGPYYAVGKDFKNNILIVSKNKKDLLKKELIASNVNWLSGKEPNLPLKVKVKIRYRATEAEAVIYKLQTTNYKLKFTKPQKAITSGQSTVFYNGEELIGGGIIE